MTYTAPSLDKLNHGVFPWPRVLHDEFVKIASALGSGAPLQKDLSVGLGTETALATAGITLTTGATYYAKFVADVPMTIQYMLTYMTEAYAKDTTDAKIELKTEAASPVTKVTYTFPTSGRAAKNMVLTTPTSATLAAGDALDVVVTATGSGSGTGHCRVILVYSLA